MGSTEFGVASFVIFFLLFLKERGFVYLLLHLFEEVFLSWREFAKAKDVQNIFGQNVIVPKGVSLHHLLEGRVHLLVSLVKSLFDEFPFLDIEEGFLSDGDVWIDA